MAVTWTLKDANDNPLTNQPGAGSPLALKFTSSGDAHLPGYTEVIDLCEATTDVSPVAIVLTPDSSGDYLVQSRSNPTEVPGEHGGTLTWTNESSGQTTLSFTAPTADNTYAWSFGADEPAVALRMRARLHRT